ncbi:hypothetical protein SAMN05216276_101018 [Streptosporangium subroseum]|uniref:Beta/Gamma crystallin n=1 Tax=Streptosporangium subroseum TaxID=106412 RepID=A0A239ESX2_9ACTN|nr:hypothetical protein [Streptosporangium subroseum]SNS46964.1 hypothetical protein SAMN05216276_101018 [Streptosporangium subroseum]
MSNRCLARLTASALLAGGLLVAAGTAPAAATVDAGVLKLWDEAGETPLEMPANQGCVGVDPFYRTSMVDNRTAYAVELFTTEGCMGEFVGLVNPWQEGTYLGRPADVQSVRFVLAVEEDEEDE